MATKTKCIVVSIRADTRAGFAIRADDDARIYIPPVSVKKLDLAPLQTVEAVLVENRRKTPGAAPWVLLRGRVLEEV